MKKKTQFMTKEAIAGHMPQWVKIVFDICLLLAFVATFIISADVEIPAELRVRIALYISGGVLFVRGLAKCFGVTLQEPDAEERRNIKPGGGL